MFNGAVNFNKFNLIHMMSAVYGNSRADQPDTKRSVQISQIPKEHTMPALRLHMHRAGMNVSCHTAARIAGCCNPHCIDIEYRAHQAHCYHCTSHALALFRTALDGSSWPVVNLLCDHVCCFLHSTNLLCSLFVHLQLKLLFECHHDLHCV